MRDGLLTSIRKCVEAEILLLERQRRRDAPEFIHGDCSNCGDEEVLLQKSEQEDEPLHYVCKECFLRGC